MERATSSGAALRTRLRTAAAEEIALTIITVEEGLRGWLAEINRHADLDRQIIPYGKLQRQVLSYADWTILEWDAESAILFRNFRA